MLQWMHAALKSPRPVMNSIAKHDFCQAQYMKPDSAMETNYKMQDLIT